MIQNEKLTIISFTVQGYTLSKRIRQCLQEYGAGDVSIYTKSRSVQEQAPGAQYIEEALMGWTGKKFQTKEPLLFIGAMGIAIRAIAPFVKDKLSDPPVLVMDEKGQFVIPVLSGHVGGANELASILSTAIGCVPVLTTATDVNDAFAVDLFAKENNLNIANRSGIAVTSRKALEGKALTMCIEHFPGKTENDIVIADDPLRAGKAGIVLCPKRYALGIGCRKGKSYEEIEQQVSAVLLKTKISWKEVGVITSIDLKKDEEGLKELSRRKRIPFLTFDAEILKEVKGDYTSSSFVSSVTGVDNVCERSAMAAAGAGARLVVRKIAENGVTAAVAEIRGWEDRDE